MSAPVHQLNTSQPWPIYGCNPEQLPFFKSSTSRSTSAPVHQSNISHTWTIQWRNPEHLLIFRALRVCPQVHQSTSQTHPTCGRSMGAIRNNALLLRLYKSVHKWTSQTPPTRKQSLFLTKTTDPFLNCVITTPKGGSFRICGQSLLLPQLGFDW